MCEWVNGGMGEWVNGGMCEWVNGGMCEWVNGGMGEWVNGGNQAYKQQYQRLQRDTGMKYKKGFFFKTLRSEVMASFTHLE